MVKPATLKGSKMTVETWDEIWLRKGLEDTDDLIKLNGYEKTGVDLPIAARTIFEALELKPGQRFLDVGCGAGTMGQAILAYCEDISYVGTDRSASLVRKHISLLGHSVLNFSAHEAVFHDNFFDCCVCYGVSHYFESHQYAAEVLGQLIRQARKVYLGDLPLTSHDATHLLYTMEMVESWLTQLKGTYENMIWEFTPGLYNPKRFNVIIKR